MTNQTQNNVVPTDAINDGAAVDGGFAIVLEKVHSWVTNFYAMIPNLIAGVVILLLFGIIAYSVGHAIKVYFQRRGRIDLGRLLADFGFWLLMALGALIALTIIIPSLAPADLLASLGLGSLAVGFAFKDILQNWLSGLLILLRLPFRRGDQIRVGDAEGTVQRIEPRATIIRTYDGRDIVVPNTMVYTSMVTIHTSKETRRVELDFTVGYAYDIRAITEIIQIALTQVKEIKSDPPPQVLCWELGSTSLGLKVRWWIDSERSQEVVSRARAVQAIKEAFDANNIDPTDPQLVFYQQSASPQALSEQNAEQMKDLAHAAASYGPPPEFYVSSSDPEAERPKIDSKDKTLLPEN